MMVRFRAKALFGRIASPWARAGIGALALAALAGCTPTSGALLGGGGGGDAATQRDTVEYTVVPASRALVSAPQALVVFERNIAGAVEQRVILPNATAAPGDNQIHILTRSGRGGASGNLDFGDVSTRFGGLPAPFEQLTASGLDSGSDALGSYVFASRTLGGNTLCVLVLRRLGPGARPLPSGTQALDVVMRNCVTGTVQEALAPMAGQALAMGGGQGAGRTLSPFAAPGT